MAHYGPVTALRFLNDETLLVGQGPTLKVYNYKTGNLKHQQRIFTREKIHGISVESGKIGVWGGRSLSVFTLSDLLAGKISETRLNNWITTASFGFDDNTFFYCLESHNTVLKINSETMGIEHRYTCDEKSILYSATLFPISKEKILVASGTVLGGVVVWDLFSGNILYNFTDHEGSIFGVAFSRDGSKLISCSDDRSIRLYDLTTGSHLATGWGHLARIWDLHFYDNSTIISVSEDCSSRIWSIEGDTLQSIQVLEGHLGRNVWCGAIEYKTKVLATGGGDGRIRLWDLEQKEKIDRSRELISLEDTQKDVLTPLTKGEVFKNYTQLQGNFLVATSTGRVIVLDSKMTFREIPLNESNTPVDTYLMIKCWEKAGVAAIASRDGNVYLVHLLNNDKVTVISNPLKAKLTDIHTWESNGTYYLLAQSQNPQDSLILSEFCINDQTLELIQQYNLTPPATFLPTSVTVYNNTSLFVGSRHGGIAVYNFRDSSEAINCWRHVAGSTDSITSLLFTEDSLHFTTRGGQFAVATISKSDENYKLNIISSNKLQKGSIEGSIYANHQKLLYGFRNDLFFIWNETNQYEIANEKCGGPHRAWQLSLDPSDESHYRFIYTKASKVVLVSSECLTKKFKSTLLQDGTHGREIRDIALSPQLLPDGTRVVASASEDTCINLATVSLDSGLKNKSTLRKHVSGLQKLLWSNDGQLLFSSAAREEFVVWKVSVPSTGDVYATPVATLPPSSDNPDLRIMSFSLTPIANSDLILVVTVYSDSAIRIWLLETTDYSFTLIGQGIYKTCCLLNVDVVVSDSRADLLISATDGHLMGWNIASILGEAKITVSNSMLSLSDTPDINKPASLPEASFRLMLHQSSVKDSIIIGPFNNLFYHISGGDDNAISLAQLDLANNEAKKTFTIPSAHATTITGLALVPHRDLIKFVTIGVDQQVKLWKVSDSFDSIELEDNKYTTVADTGSLDVASFGESAGILLGGSGLSLWKV